MKKMCKIVPLIMSFLILCTTGCSTFTANKPKKVLLVSIDGLRPDAIMNNEFVKELMATSSYTFHAKTINPSITLPAHTSMFYGVEPETHGVINNSAIKSFDLGNGITETLANAGKSSAIFYDWQMLKTLTSNESVKHTFISGKATESGKENYEESATALSDAAIKHIKETPTDFTFLYYGLTDEMGHTYKWMSDKYTWAIEHVFENLQRVLAEVPDDYVVIITSDHGGGGSFGAKDHGSEHPKDMLIPLFIKGKNIKSGILSDVSILDVAPTVVDFLGVEPEEYWAGKSLKNSKLESPKKSPQKEALDILASESSYTDVERGIFKSVKRTKNDITVCGAVNTSFEGNEFSAFGLKKDAVQKWLDLGFRYLTFNAKLSGKSGATAPTHIYIYEWAEKREFLIDTDTYIADNSVVTIDLEVLNFVLTDKYPDLLFAFTANEFWNPTSSDGYLTFSNVNFSDTLPEK